MEKNWNTEWNYVIWSDESRYNLHQNDGRQRVWHLPKEKYDVDCLVPTFKHGGGVTSTTLLFIRKDQSVSLDEI
ncbi:7404_t:CDS:2 [Entrophospora sp. SA101]|nr:7404_t:CDS:2 [Entrophospora sp. SA101]